MSTPVEGLREQRSVPDVAFDDGDRIALAVPLLEIVPASAHEIVEDNDLAWLLRCDQIGDMRADEAGTAGNQYAFVFHDLP